MLGVAPGNVRLLHTLPAASVAATATAGSVPADASAGGHAPDAGLPGTFGSRFRDALAGEAVKRLGRGKDR